MATNIISYFGENYEIKGYGIFPVLSRANHSCNPNAFLAPGVEEAREVMLIAEKPIQKGATLTWSYAVTKEFDDADYFSRNKALWLNFRFVCRCERCESECSPKMKPAELERKFRELLPMSVDSYISTYGLPPIPRSDC